MRIDCALGTTPADVEGEIAAAAEAGADGAFVSEVAHDPFVLSALAAPRRGRATIGTKIAVAFARAPMVTALAAHDLGELTDGHFVLGLGTQVRAHIARRFDMPWSSPVPRIVEYIGAVRAIWHAWRTGEPLAFEGEHYRNSLMTPTFTPVTRTVEPPRIWLACVGPRMAEAAAEVADGVVLHGFWTPRYHEEVLEPAIARGLARSGRPRSAIEVTAGGFTVSGTTPAELDAERERVRAQIAFYGSTPAYRGVLEVHGWGALGDELHALSVDGRADRWDRMTAAVPDEVLAAFAVVAERDRLAAALLERHGGYADRITVPLDPDVVQAVRRGVDRDVSAAR